MIVKPYTVVRSPARVDCREKETRGAFARERNAAWKKFTWPKREKQRKDDHSTTQETNTKESKSLRGVEAGFPAPQGVATMASTEECLLRLIFVHLLAKPGMQPQHLVPLDGLLLCARPELVHCALAVRGFDGELAPLSHRLESEQVQAPGLR